MSLLAYHTLYEAEIWLKSGWVFRDGAFPNATEKHAQVNREIAEDGELVIIIDYRESKAGVHSSSLRLPNLVAIVKKQI